MDCTFDKLRQRIEVHRLRRLDTDQCLPQAAVLVPTTRSDDPGLVLTLHVTNSSTHGGEVASPDGWRDLEGADLIRITLREAEEEIALPPGLVEVVGPLSTLVSRHGIKVAPYVAFIPNSVEHQPSDGEIAVVFDVPLSFFRDDPHEATHRIDYFGRSWYVSSYRFSELKIQDLTTIMVVELINLLCDGPIGLHTPPASFIKLS